MYVGTVNYGLYFVALKRRTLRGFRQSVEFKTFAAIVLVSVLVVTVGILGHHGGNWPTALRRAFFMVATTISSTGYGTDDYMAYPSPALLLIVVLMFIGGCSGSTAGGLKIERVVLMAKQAWLRVGAFFRPKAIQVVRMGGAVVDKSTLADVAAFFILYMVTIVVGIGLVTVVENVSLPTAFGVMLTSISNMGPAPFHEVADNFEHFSAPTHIIAAMVMLLGRLELFTLLALLSPSFWKR